MIAPKNGRKNPTMGQVDEAVRDAGARQAHESAGGAYQSPPPPPIFESRERERESEPDYAPRYREDPGLGETAQVAQAQPGPLALLAKVREWPWYVWLGVGAFGLLVASVVQEERAAANPGDDDEDDEPDEDGDEDEDDPDVEEEWQDDPGEEFDSSDEPRPRVRVKVRRTSRSRVKERVVEDDQPDQEPEESVLGDDE